MVDTKRRKKGFNNDSNNQVYVGKYKHYLYISLKSSYPVVFKRNLLLPMTYSQHALILKVCCTLCLVNCTYSYTNQKSIIQLIYLEYIEEFNL